MMAERHSGAVRGMMVVCMAILIGVELFGVALATGWAIAGLFELGDIVSYVLMALFSGLAGYALLNLMRRVIRYEGLARS